MAKVQSTSFKLEEKTLRTIQSAVDSGNYPSAEAFLEEAVESFQGEKEALEVFLRTEAQAICDRMDSGSSRRLTLAQVMERLTQDSLEEETRAA